MTKHEIIAASLQAMRREQGYLRLVRRVTKPRMSMRTS